MVFRVFLPTLLFSTITSFNLLWHAVLSLIVMVSFYMLLIPRLETDNRKRGVLVQGICRSNFIFFGMPMAATLHGGTSAGIASLMVGIRVLTGLVIVPAIGITIAILSGCRDLELILLMAMYAMAQQMDGDAELAGQIVVFTTALSLLSLFLWISLLMALGYF